jgi:hypothetical protein
MGFAERLLMTRRANQLGWLVRRLSSPSGKNISVFPKYKSGYMIRHPVPKEGRCATSSTWDGDAVDADSAFDESA